MSNRERHPDAVVTVKDRDGRFLNERNLFLDRNQPLDPMEDLQNRIGNAKEAFKDQYGSECYTFVNTYC